MDSSPSPTPKQSRTRIALLSALALAALGYGWFIYEQGAPYASGSDASGYLNSARLLARGQVSEPVRTVPGLVPPIWSYSLYQSLGCNVDRQTGRMVPSYPIGLPLHYAVAAVIVGFEKTARVVNALNALAAGALLYALGRQLGLARPWSLAAVALLWACPIWIYQSLQPMSDNVATTWSVAAILCALRARERTAWAVAAGAAFAVAVLVRPTSGMLLVPLAIALGGRWRAWGEFALGGLPFALALSVYNYSAYGNAFAIGYNYNGINVLTGGFGWQFFRGNLAHFAVWIPQLLSPPIAILAVLGLPWVIRQAPRNGWLLAGWITAFIGLYSCYFCAGETWWYLRFLLPGFSAVILAALLALQILSARLPGKVAWLAPGTLVLAGLVFQCTLTGRLHAADIRGNERHYWAASMWLKQHAPADAILLTWQLSGSSLFYNTQPIVRWDFLNPSDFELLRQTAAAQHRPIYAPLFGSEKIEMQKRLGGHWLAVGHAGIVTIWRLAGPTGVEVTR